MGMDSIEKSMIKSPLFNTEFDDYWGCRRSEAKIEYSG